MLKRTLFVLSAAVLATVAIWLMPGQHALELSTSTGFSGKQEVMARQESIVLEVPDTEEKVPQSRRHAAGEIEKHRARMLPLEEMKKAVTEQEMKVEEKRKALASIVRAKGIIYKGKDSMIEPQGHAPAADPDAAEAQVDPGNQAEMARKDAEERGRDAMAYIDAKQDFETDQNLLHYIRIKLDAERQKRRIEER